MFGIGQIGGPEKKVLEEYKLTLTSHSQASDILILEPN